MQGVVAVSTILSMTPETPSMLLGLWGNSIVKRPLMECVEQARGNADGMIYYVLYQPFRDVRVAFRALQTQSVGKALKERRFKDALELRGTEFAEAYRTFRTIARAEPRQKAEGGNVRMIALKSQ